MKDTDSAPSDSHIDDDFDASVEENHPGVVFPNSTSGSSSATGSSGKTFAFSNSRFSPHSSHVKTFESFDSETGSKEAG